MRNEFSEQRRGPRGRYGTGPGFRDGRIGERGERGGPGGPGDISDVGGPEGFGGRGGRGRGPHGGPFGGPRGGGRGGGPRGGRRRGDIRRLLLAGLLDGPAHGYELMRRLEERAGGRWRPSPGSVYPMLQQLEDEGLVKGVEGEGRKAFELTEDGRAQADAAALDELDGDAEAEVGAQLRDELAQLHMAVRQIRTVGGDTEIAQAAAEAVKQARQTVYRLLAEA